MAEGAVAEAPTGADYRELKQRIAAAGLLDRQPRYYAPKIALTIGVYLSALATIPFASSLWSAMVLALLAGLLSIQVGFLLHDVAHRQVFPPGLRADVLLLVTGPLLSGVGGDWWKRKHDLHHAHPNDAERDPDVQISFLAFSPEQSTTKSRLVAFVTRYQAYVIFPMLLFEGLQLRAATVKHLVTGRPRHAVLEGVFFAMNVVGYVTLFTLAVGWPAALVALFVREAALGVYAGMVFAPNHKGMPMVEGEHEFTFLERQVLTSRNVRGNALVDWWYGGLNYQIEHHLFPTLPRNLLSRTRPLVKAFCAERGLRYHETSLAQSFREIFAGLHEASAPLRQS